MPTRKTRRFRIRACSARKKSGPSVRLGRSIKAVHQRYIVGLSLRERRPSLEARRLNYYMPIIIALRWQDGQLLIAGDVWAPSTVLPRKYTVCGCGATPFWNFTSVD
jgi:hypothetical protein